MMEIAIGLLFDGSLVLMRLDQPIVGGGLDFDGNLRDTSTVIRFLLINIFHSMSKLPAARSMTAFIII